MPRTSKSSKTSKATRKASNSNSKANLDNMKYEVANEVGVNLKKGYNGDLTTKQAGSVGGKMVKNMVQQATQKSKK